MQLRHFHEKKGLARFCVEILMILSLSLGSFSPVFAQNEVTPEASETPTEVSTEATPTETATEVPTESPTLEITPTPDATATETATETLTDETSTAEATEGLTPTVEPTLSAEQLAQYYTAEEYTTNTGKELNRIEIHGPSEPPAGFITNDIEVLPQSGITLYTPAYKWVFGCSAVSGAMIAGYYDRSGYPNIYTGPANNGVAPIVEDSTWGKWSDNEEYYPGNPIVASKSGTDQHSGRGTIDDYWVKYLSTNKDPYITKNLTQHTWGTAIGDYMKTSQSAYDNVDGSTSFYLPASSSKYTCDQMEFDGVSEFDGTYGQKEFYEARGYTVTDCYTQYTDNYEPGGFSFTDYVSEIDAGHPVMLNLEGHTIVGVGYDLSTRKVFLHNTWDSGTDSMTWGGLYTGMKLWGGKYCSYFKGTSCAHIDRTIRFYKQQFSYI